VFTLIFDASVFSRRISEPFALLCLKEIGQLKDEKVNELIYTANLCKKLYVSLLSSLIFLLVLWPIFLSSETSYKASFESVVIN
jgi:hypothetical protein